MPSVIVGLCGRKRSGKDTLAEELVERYGYTRVAFADPLREMLLALDPVVEQGDYTRTLRVSDMVATRGWEDAKAHPEVRRLLQRLGTEAGRVTLGENVWIDAARRKIDAIEGPVVVTDVRFPNEADAIKDWGGYLARVVRPGYESSDDTHVSESAMDDYLTYADVQNDGTVTELKAKAERIDGWVRSWASVCAALGV